MEDNRTRNRGDGRLLAVIMAAVAAMVLCFALRSTAMVFPDRIPYEPPSAGLAEGEGLVDVNTAGLEELMALPRIGEVRARAIVEYRESHGPFRYPEDLIRVEGIGEGILSGLLDQITTGGYRDAENIGG